MAKKTRISALEYKSLKDALCKANYSAPGVLARVLLEAFIYENGDINADWFVREKACSKGMFTKLRNRLINDQWLYFREDSKRYFAATRLKTHLDVLKGVKTVTLAQFESLSEQKADRSELSSLDAIKADRTELELRLAETNNKLEETNSRIDAIAVAVRELQDAMLPPDSLEKKAVREKSARKIALLAH